MDGITIRTETFSLDRKLKYIEMHPKGDTYLVIFIKILLIARDMNDHGFIRFLCKKSEEIQLLSEAVGKAKKDVSAALKLFEECDLIERESGLIRIKSFGKYTAEDEIERERRKTRERVARHRERKKQEKFETECNVTESKKALQCNVTPPAPPSPSSSLPLVSPSLPSPNNPIYYSPYNPPHNISHILHNPIHSLVQSCASAREGTDGTMDMEKVLLEYYPPETVAGADAAKRKQMMRLINERMQLKDVCDGVVFMSDIQMDALYDICSMDEITRYIRIVADAELSGKHYKAKTHFQAVLEMIEEDRKI
jgi:predicted phage replisome organizer